MMTLEQPQTEGPTMEGVSEAKPVIYCVPECNYNTLVDRIARLQRRARKLNSGEIVMTEVRREEWADYILYIMDGERRGFLPPSKTRDN